MPQPDNGYNHYHTHNGHLSVMKTVSANDHILFKSNEWNIMKVLYKGEIWKLTSPAQDVYKYENTRVIFR